MNLFCPTGHRSPGKTVLRRRPNSEPATQKGKAFPAERAVGGQVLRLEESVGVRGSQGLSRLRAGRGETADSPLPKSPQGRKSGVPAARPGCCSLRRKTRWSCFMSPLPLTSRPREGPTWDIGVSPELVRQMVPVGWLWTPTPDQKGTGHHLWEWGDSSTHAAASSTCCQTSGSG